MKNLLIISDSANASLISQIFNYSELKVTILQNLDLENIINIIKPDLIILESENSSLIIDNLKELKSNLKTYKIPVINITNSSEDIEELSLNLGANDFIKMPFKDSVVLARVNNQLKQIKIFKEEQNITDIETGLSTRFQFNKVFNKEFNRVLRNNSLLGLILIEVNFNKQIEKSKSYQFLDVSKILVSIAQTISLQLKRAADLVARYDSNLFICLLPETDINGCNFLANKIQGLIKDNYELIVNYKTVSEYPKNLNSPWEILVKLEQ